MRIRRGSSGAKVEEIQRRLRELGLYRGPVDGLYGGGTEAAVKTFQQARALAVDGIVGFETWAALFPGEPAPETEDPTSYPLAQRCLALTGSFETGAGIPECYAGLTGDFDGQGLSLGVLQWNLGQGSLQPLLIEMLSRHRDVCSAILHEHLPVFEAMLGSSKAEQLAWARSIQDVRRSRVLEPWRGLLKAIARTPEFQAIQVEAAGAVHQRAVAMAAEYGLETERAVALMFDICTQNGSISALVRAQILQDFAALRFPPGSADAEVVRMRIIAERRAAAARPEFVEDVRARKLTIANGRGTVHGIEYDLEEYGLRLHPYAVDRATA
ncbi:MAG TPA: peptidoglycan-binding domain-containing protein [Bryobacteraceae bacterium]|nr:peptidoglycan-binding domain-containing protein [Bryobacteraceae bacterium]HOL72934.1 peptidoglycan-binding domain-containing protein [Bryobacteraceae bacterium]HPQ17356.1 peptidoglycan-binding domain-containing protein [Bryobacteraceae bacterium]